MTYAVKAGAIVVNPRVSINALSAERLMIRMRRFGEVA